MVPILSNRPLSIMMPTRDSLSLTDARRITLAHQGLARPRPAGPVTRQEVRDQLDALSLLQIDSVNVLVRSHYLPLFSRLGAYAPGDLDVLALGKRRKTFEYWGHEASLMPVELQPLFRWRMEDARQGLATYSGLYRFACARQDYIRRVKDEIRDRGPLGAGFLTEGGRGSGGWWGWSDGKHAVEWLFWTGELTTHERRNFERIYDLSERSLPSRSPTCRHPTATRPSASSSGDRSRPSALRRSAIFATTSGCRCRHPRQAGRAGRGRRGAAGQGRGLEGHGFSAAQGRAATISDGHGAADTLRLARLRATAHRTAVRFPLPHRALLHARAQAHIWLLCSSLPDGRSAGGARRSQGRSGQGQAARGGRLRRAGDPCGSGRGGIGGRVAIARALARSRAGRRRPARRSGDTAAAGPRAAGAKSCIRPAEHQRESRWQRHPARAARRSPPMTRRF